MGKVFLSYAKEDRARAEWFVNALEAQGWDVWWDHEIPVGQTWAEVIEESIGQADCVVVLWSKHSVQSRWVKKEARHAFKRGNLAPVIIDETEVPFEFEDLQAARLEDWTGEASPQLTLLLERISELAGPPELADSSTQPESEATQADREKRTALPSRKTRKPLWIVGGLTVIAGILVTVMIMSLNSTGNEKLAELEPPLTIGGESPEPPEEQLQATTEAVRQSEADSTPPSNRAEPPTGELLRLVAQLNDTDRRTRMRATDVMTNQYGGDSLAIRLVLETLDSGRLDALSPQGMVNTLFYLSATRPTAWTPELVALGRQAMGLLNARREQGRLGPQAAGELADLEALLPPF